VLDNVARIVAVELATASRAASLRAPLTSSPSLTAARAVVDAATGGPGPDRFLSPELRAVELLVRDRLVTQAVADAGVVLT
jgi:histidine ammonia-lyase